jgi:hypothetical protein
MNFTSNLFTAVNNETLKMIAIVKAECANMTPKQIAQLPAWKQRMLKSNGGK